MKKILLALLGLILLGMLSFYCFNDKARSIKEHLISKADSTLNAHDLGWVKPELVGQGLESTNIVRLTGSTPSEDAKIEAERLVMAVDGVGGVDNQITLSTPEVALNEQESKIEEQEPKEEEEVVPTAQKTMPKVEDEQESKKLDKEKKEDTPSNAPKQYSMYIVKNGKGRVFIEGFVPTKEAKNELLQKAYSLFKKENVEDKIDIAENAPKDWNYITQFGLDNLSQVDYGDMNITEASYLFKGHLPSHEKKISFLEGIKKIMSNPDNNYGRYRGDFIVTAPIKDAPKVAKNDTKQATPAKTKQKTKPVKRVVSCQDALNSAIASRKIHFDYDKSNVNSDSYKILDDLLYALNSCDLSGNILEIGGHTDSRGSRSYNQKLSQKRADNIKRYLVNKGFDASKIRAIGYGESRPIASNMTKDGRAQNRRIEFKIKGVR